MKITAKKKRNLKVTDSTKISVTERKVRQVKEFAERAFSEHVIECKHNDGVYRHFDCGKPGGGSSYRFFITTFPGTLTVTGDIGDLMVQRVYDMFEWAPDSVRSFEYFAEKVVAGKVKVYDPELVMEEIESLREQASEEDKKLINDLIMYVDPSDMHYTAYHIYNSGLFNGCDFPNFETWDSNFLWCREAVEWFFENMERKDGKD
jgi:hypothetical protein